MFIHDKEETQLKIKREQVQKEKRLIRCSLLKINFSNKRNSHMEEEITHNRLQIYSPERLGLIRFTQEMQIMGLEFKVDLEVEQTY